MTPDDGSEQLEQKEEVEYLAGIPFSIGPFETKDGPRSPKRGNLYLNKTMRRFLINSKNFITGPVPINGKVYDIRQARHCAKDGRLRNIIHPEDMDAVRQYLSEEMKFDKTVEEKTGVAFYTGEFKTKKGVRFPEGRTIYATAELRKLLEVDEVPGSIEIDGDQYTVRQARKPIDGNEFVNVVHPIEEPFVQRFLIEKLHGSQAVMDEVKSRAGEVLSFPDYTKEPLYQDFMLKLQSRKRDVLSKGAVLLEGSTIEDVVDRELIEKALEFIENPEESLSSISPHTTNIGNVLAGYMMQGLDDEIPPEIDAISAYLFALQCVSRINYVEEGLVLFALGIPDTVKLQKAIDRGLDWATTLSKGYSNNDFYPAIVASFTAIFKKLQERLDSHLDKIE